MECLDEETILGFCRGEITADVRARAQEHIGTCDECRALVSAVARSSIPEFPLPPRPEEEPVGSRGLTAPDLDPDAREPGPMLRGDPRRVDPAMAPTTPSGGAGRGGPAASPVQPGEILAGKYEVERVLGAGGMGIVVAARHTQLEQRVALKFLLPVACEVPGAVARFLREGKAAARITSEHVARVIDTGVLDVGAPYLVMEYLEGSDLGAVVERRGRLPADEAIDYVLQACEAIVEAHDLGIVHRDLKPANLFLSRRADGSPLVKVLDFGISKVEGSGSRSQLTSASVLMGSPRYMSPEQMLSAKDVDARTDVWALGVILYELVCGKPVWHADTVQGLCALIASSPAPLLRVLAPEAPAILEDVVARCLAKSVGDRIASVADLALALEPIAPERAKTSIDRILRVGKRDRALPPAQTPPPPSAAMAVAAEVTTAGGRPRGSGRVGIVLAIGVAVLLVAGIALNATRTPTGEVGAGVASALATSAPAPTVSVTAQPSRASAASAASATGATGASAEGAPAAATGSVPQVPASAPRRVLRVPPPAVVPGPPPNVASSSKVGETPPASPGGESPAPSNRALTDRK